MRTGMLAGRNNIPMYVLLCDGQQVGAIDAGYIGNIVFFKIFDAYRGVGHSEVFLELLELEARRQGVERIKFLTPATNPRMVKALIRQGFQELERDNLGDIYFYKDL